MATEPTEKKTTDKNWKIGELARAAGLTVRTLHHYDDIGLLRPSERTPSGHRLYTGADVRRLYQVVTLRGFGLTLDEVGRILADGEAGLRDVVAKQLARVDALLIEQRALRDRLSRLLAALDRAETDPADFLDIIERTTMIENYYTPEQLQFLAERREQIGEEGIRRVEQEWQELFARAEAFRAEDRDPADPQVQGMLDRMDELVAMFHGGDAGVQASLQRLWDEQGGQLRAQCGPPPHVQAFLERARVARRSGE